MVVAAQTSLPFDFERNWKSRQRIKVGGSARPVWVSCRRRIDARTDGQTDRLSQLVGHIAPRCEVQSRPTRSVCKIGFMDLSLLALESPPDSNALLRCHWAVRWRHYAIDRLPVWRKIASWQFRIDKMREWHMRDLIIIIIIIIIIKCSAWQRYAVSIPCTLFFIPDNLYSPI